MPTAAQIAARDALFTDGWIQDLNAGKNASFAIAGALFSLLMSMFFAWQVTSIPLDERKAKTIRISQLIANGADAFLRAEYKALFLFLIAVFALLAGFVGWQTAVCFAIGAAFSASTGWMGMKISTKSNIRTTLASQGAEGLNNGLQVAFRSGAVMALSVVGTGLLGVSLLYVIFSAKFKVWDYLSGYAFGGSSIALFARVGGGIYTKAADVGADLVGKVEEELDEDSPENPATIADNVGDNVGDVAGMGADLFESYVGSIVAACTLGREDFGDAGIALPFWIAGFGAVASVIGVLMVRTKRPEKSSQKLQEHAGMDAKMIRAKESEAILEQLLWSIRWAIYGASFIMMGLTAVAVGLTFGGSTAIAWELFACVLMGLICGNLIGYATEFATSFTYRPTQSVAEKSDTGPATVLIQGLGVGMLSTVPPMLFIVATILGSYYAVNNFYGPAVSAVGMLSTLGVTLATDAFGPVADNAGGIAEMAPHDEIDREVRDTTDALDALGNTTAATGKGFAIASAVLTAIALLNAFRQAAGLSVIDVLDPVILPGILLGGLLPYVFAALTMLSVGKAAEAIMWECRAQLNDKYLRGKELDSQRCVAISTVASLHEMVAPGTLAIVCPVIIGTLIGNKALMGVLAGAISSGALLAIMMANAGGAWDNAKKYVEKGLLGEGKGKKSVNHKATVVGDTVGDPFKDTSGPALNILIKLMSIVALVLGATFNNDSWDSYWVGIVVIIVTVVLSAAYVMFFGGSGGGFLHDHDKILADSKKRHQMQAAERGDDQKAH